MSRRSCGRSSTHTLSSLSTANPVTPPNFQLFGKGFGQSGSNLYFGVPVTCARGATDKTNKQRPADTTIARIHARLSLLISPSSYRVFVALDFQRRPRGV